uniref:Uncharacterized protein n=1 Tax=Romanomermis culicivorax TaxID=13658 RepID=A0A915IAW8_ROMCU
MSNYCDLIIKVLQVFAALGVVVLLLWPNTLALNPEAAKSPDERESYIGFRQLYCSRPVYPLTNASKSFSRLNSKFSVANHPHAANTLACLDDPKIADKGDCFCLNNFWILGAAVVSFLTVLFAFYDVYRIFGTLGQQEGTMCDAFCGLICSILASVCCFITGVVTYVIVIYNWPYRCTSPKNELVEFYLVPRRWIYATDLMLFVQPALLILEGLIRCVCVIISK